MPLLFRIPVLTLAAAAAAAPLAWSPPAEGATVYQTCRYNARSSGSCHRSALARSSGSSSPTYARRTFAPRDFAGHNKFDRWYNHYVARCAAASATPVSKSRARTYYPYSPPVIPNRFR